MHLPQRTHLSICEQPSAMISMTICLKVSALWLRGVRYLSTEVNWEPSTLNGQTSTQKMRMGKQHTTRPFQQPNHIELSMNMFPATSAPSMVPFTAGAYGFDPTSMSQYPVQQNYNISYTPAMQQQAAYPTAPTELPSTMPHIREARNALPSLNRSPSVKTEAQSPIHSNQAYAEASSDELKIGQADGPLGGVSFSTDVDCLMKAIQSKQKSSPPPSPKVGLAATGHVQHKVDTSQVQLTTDGRNKARKRYHCSTPYGSFAAPRAVRRTLGLPLFERMSLLEALRFSCCSHISILSSARKQCPIVAIVHSRTITTVRSRFPLA